MFMTMVHGYHARLHHHDLQMDVRAMAYDLLRVSGESWLGSKAEQERQAGGVRFTRLLATKEPSSYPYKAPEVTQWLIVGHLKLPVFG